MEQVAAELAIVIVNYRTPDLAIACVEALAPERDRAGPFDVIVVDGASGDGSAERLQRRFADAPWADWVSILPLDFNGGFGWANNQAMLRLLQRERPPQFIHILNPDTVIEPGAVAALVAVLRANPRVGAVGSQLYEPDGAPANSAFRFPSVGREFMAGVTIARLGPLLGIKGVLHERGDLGPVDWVTGASVLFRSAALRESGLFDDGFFLYYEEVELQKRVRRAGWEIWYVPESRVMHVGGAATGAESGVTRAVKPIPPYRYEARRRCLHRTLGVGGLMLANVLWVSARLFARAIGRRDGGQVPEDMRRMLRYSFLPAARDFRASFPSWDEPSGRAPAWTKR